MARVVWERRENIQSAYKNNLIPPVIKGSDGDFRPPPTIEDDFRRYLNHDVPHVNYTFELLYNWYDIGKTDYEPLYIRAQQTPIDWKSKIGNSDMTTNFKTTHDIPIHKGDMVIREDGMVFLLNWNVQIHPNNQASQALECNANVEFTRWFDDEVNDQGYLVRKRGMETIVPSIPISHSEYAGRPDFSEAQGNPGLHPDHIITVYLQWNDKTKNIEIGDYFYVGDWQYRVVNTSYAEVNIDREYGVFTLGAKRVAGGETDER